MSLVRSLGSIGVVLLAIIAATGVRAAEHADATPPHWGYTGATGPEHWGDLESDFAACSHGHRQSPIDIHNAKPADLPPIQFDYKRTGLHVVDNGHTIMVNVDPGSSILVGKQRFALVQFHFHKPSEEHVDGKEFPMVVHLVHKDDKGHLAVVAVLLTSGDSNGVVELVWGSLPQAGGEPSDFPAVTLDPAGLLPRERGYYTFEGSLTTPPCTEGVTWFVMKTPVTVSTSEIDRFGKRYPGNARPVQPQNDRAVKMTR